jgi:hypothetical protein
MSPEPPRVCQRCRSAKGDPWRRQAGGPSGANALIFPNLLANLTAAERLELLNLIVFWMMHKRAGL